MLYFEKIIDAVEKIPNYMKLLDEIKIEKQCSFRNAIRYLYIRHLNLPIEIVVFGKTLEVQQCKNEIKLAELADDDETYDVDEVFDKI